METITTISNALQRSSQRDLPGHLVDWQRAASTTSEPREVCPQLEAFTTVDAVGTILQAQVQAIWPQERELVARYALPANPAVLDVGCGTGEFELALARHWPAASIVGLDVAPELLETARRRTAGLANVALVLGSGESLPFADGSFDIVFCRHVLQAIQNPEAVLDEMLRVLRPGGVLHLLPEDLGMVHDSTGARGADRLWHAGWIDAGRNTGIDLCIGRKLPAMLLQRGLRDVAADFVVVDPLRVDRALLKQIFAGWREFADDWVAKHSSMPSSELDALFAGFLTTLDDPAGYVVWQVPIISAVKPASYAA